MSGRFQEKKYQSQLVRARKTIQLLDEKEGRDRWFAWPEVVPPRGTLADEGMVAPPSRAEGEEEVEGEEKGEDEQVWEALTLQEKLEVVVAYLRQEYYYCPFCGHQYQSQEELDAECPGLTEDVH